MAEVLAELVAKITADVSELKKGLAESEKDIEKTGKSFNDFAKDNKQAFKTVGVAVTAFGAAIVGLMTAAVKSFAGFGTELKELSQKTGISVESLSELKYAGEMAGVSLDTLAVAIRSMANFMDTATSRSKESTATLKKLGLSISDLKGLSPEQLFMKVSSAVAAIPDPMRRSAMAVDVFGRSGTQLLPMLAEGAEGITKLRQKAVELGITMSTETAEGADALGDALDTVKASMGGVFNAIGSQLAPIITDLAGKVADVFSKVIAWSRAHPGLSKNILLVAGGLGILSLALGPIIVFLPQIITQLAALKIALVTVSAAMGPVGWAIAGIGAALVIALPFILSTIKSTKELTIAERDLAEQTARMNLQNIVGANSWAILSAGGKIHEEQLAAIAGGAGMTTKALYQMLRAANMVQDVWGGEEGIIYLNNLEDIKEKIKGVSAVTEELTNEQQQLNEIWGQFSADISPTVKAFDEYNLTTEDVIRYMTRTGKSIDDVIASLKTQGITANNVKYNLDKLGISAKDVGEYVGKKRIEIERETASDKVAITITDNLTKSLNNQSDGVDELTTSYGELGIALTATQTRIAELEKVYPTLSGQARESAILELYSRRQAENIAAQTGETPAAAYERITGGSYGEYQKGGIITRPTMALLGEQAPGIKEAIIPETDWDKIGGQGGITINFTQPVFFDREDTMNKFVDMIRKGIQRQDRLRFGGAYSG